MTCETPSVQVGTLTFEDNKIQSTELTSEGDKFIHILYDVFLAICAGQRPALVTQFGQGADQRQAVSEFQFC